MSAGDEFGRSGGVMTNLVAVREHNRDDPCGCSGCGKDCYVSYVITGRHDSKDEYNTWNIYLCYKCYQPFESKIELIKV